MNLTELNALPPDRLQAELLRCCGAANWSSLVAERAPFATTAELHRAASSAFDKLQPVDWLQAFAAHPEIGDAEAIRKRFARTADWSEGEQAAVKHAEEDVLQGLAEGNRKYADRFGYIFIVCATGKSAAEMLDLLQARLGNDPSDELKIAAKEQRKITDLRLQKLLAPSANAPAE